VNAEFISGATMAAALVIAVFFFRYWRQTRDRLFLGFAGGFLVFAVSRLILAFLEEDDEGRVFVYALRLLAFGLILAAIIDKNRSRPAERPAARLNGNGPDTSAGSRRTATRL
jgi:Family of unknown function (DUF5985)